MYARLPGFIMAYEEHGVGIPLLLVHAFPLNRSMWELQNNDMTDIARVIAPDLRGFGASEHPKGAYSMEIMADDCHALLESAAGGQPAVICGLSMGGYVAMTYYRKYPDKVRGLVLAGTRAGADPPEGKANRDKAAEQVLEQGIGALVADMLPKMLAPKTYATDPELVTRVESIMMDASVNGVVGALMAMKDRPDSSELLTHVQVPTLILHGADDQLISPEEAGKMHAAIKDSRLIILADAGHLCNLEQPGLFNEALREFLESL
jgi:3-oxoadipate enol-lactonase